MLTKKIILATILVVTIVLAGSASLASLSVNVKALGNDTFTAHPQPVTAAAVVVVVVIH